MKQGAAAHVGDEQKALAVQLLDTARDLQALAERLLLEQTSRPARPAATDLLAKYPSGMRVTDVAKELQISKTSVYELIYAGKLPVFHPSAGGKRIRIATSVLQRWLEEQSHPFGGA